MLENYFVSLYLCFIIALQSCVGVGVLVLGTPFLLILGYNIVEIFFLLLPVSILTSLINLIIIKVSSKNLDLASFKEFNKFLIACVPSIIIGLILLKYFQNYINFKILVSLVIIFSILLLMIKNKITFKINFFRISILSIVGVIHGLTNSGGTLMSLILSDNKQKIDARYSITFFYFLLALIQYFITLLIFQSSIINPFNLHFILVLIFGIFLGNLLIKFLSEDKYKLMINFLAITSSVILFFS
tara:strand:+ start:1685 stop:2416 length:732 start_codon:yes stop_codon:yes gene_type:complete